MLLVASVLLATALSVPPPQPGRPCTPNPLPSPENRTEAVWMEYMAETLQLCFGGFPETATTEMVVTEAPGGMAGCLACSRQGSRIYIPKRWLDTIESEDELLFLQGHEFGHVVACPKIPIGGHESDFLADQFAAEHLRGGACAAARVLQELMLERSPMKDELTPEQGDLVRQRVFALRAQCALPILLMQDERQPN